MLLSPILLLGFQLIFFSFSFFNASCVVICDGIDTGQDQTILVTFFLWSYNVCRQSWSLVSSRKFKCKEWDREFTKLHNFPPAMFTNACWTNKKAISQMTMWTTWRKKGTPRTEIWKWWRSRKANMAKDNLRILRKRTFVVDIPPPAVPSKIIQEVIQRNANEIHQGPGSKESLKSSFNFCLLDKW